MNKYNLVLDYKDVTSESGVTWPLTVQEVKDYLRLEGFIDENESESPFTDDDGLIQELIEGAVTSIEEFCGISLRSRTMQSVVTNLAGMIEIPFGPVSSVTEILDEDGDEIESTNYTLIGVEFKMLKCPLQENMTITAECGYSTIPSRLKDACFKEIAYRYVHRGDEEDKGICLSSLKIAKQFQRGWRYL